MVGRSTGLARRPRRAGPHDTWLLVVEGLAAAVGFVAPECGGPTRIVPTGAWAARRPLGAALASVTFFVAQTFLPLLLQSRRGHRIRYRSQHGACPVM